MESMMPARGRRWKRRECSGTPEVHEHSDASRHDVSASLRHLTLGTHLSQRVTTFIFNNIPALYDLSPLFSITFPLCSGLWKADPLFSETFPLRSFNFEKFFFSLLSESTSCILETNFRVLILAGTLSRAVCGIGLPSKRSASRKPWARAQPPLTILAYHVSPVKKHGVRVLVSIGMGIHSSRRSFPRKRESSPTTTHFQRFAE